MICTVKCLLLSYSTNSKDGSCIGIGLSRLYLFHCVLNELIQFGALAPVLYFTLDFETILIFNIKIDSFLSLYKLQKPHISLEEQLLTVFNFMTKRCRANNCLQKKLADDQLLHFTLKFYYRCHSQYALKSEGFTIEFKSCSYI